MRKYFFPFVIVVFTILLIACRDSNSRKNPYINSLNLQPSYLAMMDTPNYTTIGFENLEYDFGKLNAGDSVKHNFKFTNIGKKPLFINSIMTSCGCTISEYSKDPIFPDESSEIKVSFNSLGQSGAIHKTITVETNTSNSSRHVLLVKGEVVDVSDDSTYKPIIQ